MQNEGLFDALKAIQDLFENKDRSRGSTTDDYNLLFDEVLRTICQLNGTIYEQVNGTPMRAPISRLTAEAVLQKLEKK